MRFSWAILPLAAFVPADPCSPRVCCKQVLDSSWRSGEMAGMILIDYGCLIPLNHHSPGPLDHHWIASQISTAHDKKDSSLCIEIQLRFHPWIYTANSSPRFSTAQFYWVSSPQTGDVSFKNTPPETLPPAISASRQIPGSLLRFGTAPCVLTLLNGDFRQQILRRNHWNHHRPEDLHKNDM